MISPVAHPPCDGSSRVSIGARPFPFALAPTAKSSPEHRRLPNRLLRLSKKVACVEISSRTGALQGVGQENQERGFFVRAHGTGQ